MAKFKIEYENGLVEEVEQTECTTVEQFVNMKFGSAPPAKVTLAGKPAEPEKKVAKK